MPRLKLPAPVMAFAVEPKSRGDEEKVLASLRRLQEEDPTIDLHRDPQTGEQIVAGLSQVHVEVIVDRLRDALRRRGHAASRRACPTGRRSAARRTATGATRSSPAGAGQFGDCQIEIEPLADGESGPGFEFVNKIKGGVIPSSFIPRGREGRARGDAERACSRAIPCKGVRVRLFDGAYHSVDSSEIAFKLAGVQAMKQALGAGRPGAARADHARDAVGARGERRRRDRRSQQPPRAPAGDGARRAR